MAKYLSNRQRNLKIGINSYTENQTVLEVTGKVGIGTTNATQPLDVNGNIRLRAALQDVYGKVGIAGSILISTGAGVSWTSPYAAGLQGLQGSQEAPQDLRQGIIPLLPCHRRILLCPGLLH